MTAQSDPFGGLSPPELRLYERLLGMSRPEVGQLAATAEDQALFRQHLASLQARGFVVQVAVDPPRVEARHPQEAFAVALAEQRQQAQANAALVDELTARYAQSRRTSISLDLLEVVNDPGEVLRQYDELQRLAVRQIRACDRPPYVSDPDDDDGAMLDRLAAGVRYRVLSDPRSRGLRSPSRVQGWARAGVAAREMTDLPLKLVIADDVRALLVLDSRDARIVSSLVVHPSALLQGLIAVFESLWKLAVPLPAPPLASEDGASGSHTRDNDLLSLLAAGMTEEMIARRLGVSSRTVQRRVHALTEQLGATNRFQAGLWAGHRGWL